MKADYDSIAEHWFNARKALPQLKPNGVLILSNGGSENDIPAFTDQMFGHTFFYDSFTVKQLLNHCFDIGFEVIASVTVNEPDGKRDKGRLGIILRKQFNQQSTM